MIRGLTGCLERLHLATLLQHTLHSQCNIVSQLDCNTLFIHTATVCCNYTSTLRTHHTPATTRRVARITAAKSLTAFQKNPSIHSTLLVLGAPSRPRKLSRPTKCMCVRAGVRLCVRVQVGCKCMCGMGVSPGVGAGVGVGVGVGVGAGVIVWVGEGVGVVRRCVGFCICV